MTFDSETTVPDRLFVVVERTPEHVDSETMIPEGLAPVTSDPLSVEVETTTPEIWA